ncbi:MAG: TIR domain-containing protein [Saprospiraceae bacterium]
MSAQPPLVFIIYAREDEPFRAELKAQLLPMERSGVLRVWTDRELIAGEHWEPEIKKNLKNADIILVLVSSDYFQSDYIHEVELREAIERHDRGEARVVPVIVRPCVWDTDPVVSRTQVLPTDGVPVNDTRHWHSREAAWVDVVQGVRRTLAQLLQERAAAETARRAAEETESTRRAAEEQRARETEAARLREQQARETEAQRHQAEATRARKEAFDWNLAQQTATTEAFSAYLNAYPTGAYAREARKRLRQTQSSSSGSSPTLRYVAIAVAALALASCWS